MLKVAITGGIACGKSALLRLLRESGAATIDSDGIVARLYRKREIKESLGREFGTADKKKISKIVFASRAKRKRLEHILHPPAKAELRREFERLKKKKAQIVFVEVPLLFEAKMEKMFDFVVAVKAPRERQIARLRKLGFCRKEALQRISAHLPQRQKLLKADFAIDNSKGMRHLKQQARALARELKEISAAQKKS